jgi:hypothetical protein
MILLRFLFVFVFLELFMWWCEMSYLTYVWHLIFIYFLND